MVLKMIKTKKFILIFLIFLFSLFQAYGLTCGFAGPATGSTLYNYTRINVSYEPETGDNVTHLFLNFSSPSTRNSTNKLTITARNGSADLSSSINTSLTGNIILEDSNDYTVTAFVSNTTANVTCNATRTFIVDRSTPTLATGITFTNPVQDGNTITATINRANTNRCWVLFGGNARTAMTISGSTCTYTASRGSQSPADGVYDFKIQADDRTNITNTASQYVTIDADQSDGGGLFGDALIVPQNSFKKQSAFENPFTSTKKTKNDSWIIWAVVGFLAYLIFKKK